MGTSFSTIKHNEGGKRKSFVLVPAWAFYVGALALILNAVWWIVNWVVGVL